MPTTALDLPQPYLLFLGAAADSAFVKTAQGLRDWAPQRCIGEYACPHSGMSVGLPAMTPTEACAAGARAVVIGVANMGGVIRDSWLPPLLAGLHAGLDIISGTHAKLDEVPVLKAEALRLGRKLINVRPPPTDIPVATGRKRSGKRL